MEKIEFKKVLLGENEKEKDHTLDCMQFEFCTYSLKKLVAKIKPDDYKNKLKSFNL